MDGEYHTDDECEMTCLYMLYGEGDFNLKDEKHFDLEIFFGVTQSVKDNPKSIFSQHLFI